MIKSRLQYAARAQIARALAHPTRLLLLDLLLKKELCVFELTEMVSADQSTVSKHLAILKDAGFVEAEKRGTMSVYSISCPCLDQFFECIESVLRQKVRAQRELVNIR